MLRSAGRHESRATGATTSDARKHEIVWVPGPSAFDLALPPPDAIGAQSGDAIGREIDAPPAGGVLRLVLDPKMPPASHTARVMMRAPRSRSTSDQVSASSSPLRAPEATEICINIAAIGWFASSSRPASFKVSATVAGSTAVGGTAGGVASSHGVVEIGFQRRAWRSAFFGGCPSIADRRSGDAAIPRRGSQGRAHRVAHPIANDRGDDPDVLTIAIGGLFDAPLQAEPSTPPSRAMARHQGRRQGPRDADRPRLVRRFVLSRSAGSRNRRERGSAGAPPDPRRQEQAQDRYCRACLARTADHSCLCRTGRRNAQTGRFQCRRPLYRCAKRAI